TLQDLGDIRLELRMRSLHLIVVRRVGVAQTCEEVCDRIGHGHSSTSTPFSLRFPYNTRATRAQAVGLQQFGWSGRQSPPDEFVSPGGPRGAAHGHRCALATGPV